MTDLSTAAAAEPAARYRARASSGVSSRLRFRDLGRRPLPEVWAEMQAFTDARKQGTPDEIWFVEHPPVYTLGMNSDPRHVLAPGEIPVVQTDRGGQVTYHGPGQLVAYVLLDLRRSALIVRGLVDTLEAAVVGTVAAYGVAAHGRRDARGVYVGDAKLAAIGLRVRRHCSYHGLAVNVAMDLEPFCRINPCGYEAMQVTQLSALCDVDTTARLAGDLKSELTARFA